MKSIGKEIDSLLHSKGIKKKDFAQAIGMTDVNLSKVLKKSSVDAELLERMANALGVPVTFFFDYPGGNNSASGNQSISGHGNTISGNVSITLPDKGYQKIIRSDGSQTTVEVANPYGDNDPRELAVENMALQKENSDLKNKIIELQGKLLEGK